MRILSLNIRHGGGLRAQMLAGLDVKPCLGRCCVVRMAKQRNRRTNLRAPLRSIMHSGIRLSSNASGRSVATTTMRHARPASPITVPCLSSYRGVPARDLIRPGAWMHAGSSGDGKRPAIYHHRDEPGSRRAPPNGHGRIPRESACRRDPHRRRTGRRAGIGCHRLPMPPTGPLGQLPHGGGKGSRRERITARRRPP